MQACPLAKIREDSHVVYDGKVLDDLICFPVIIGPILDAILTGRTPTIYPQLNIHINRDLQCYMLVSYHTLALNRTPNVEC